MGTLRFSRVKQIEGRADAPLLFWGTDMKRGSAKSCLLVFTALSAALGAVSFPHAAMAQSGNAQATLYEFNLPEQPLSQSVLQVGSIGRIQVLYSDDDGLRVTAPALKGRMTVDQALSTLLAGTGYAYEYTRPGAVTLRRVNMGGNGDGERMLGAVRVEAASQGSGGLAGATSVNGINGSRDVTATEGTGSYTTGAMTVGTKMAKSIKDTTASVSVVTSQQIQDRRLTDLQSVLQQTPGVTMVQNGNSLSTIFYSRGFAINNILVDGSPSLSLQDAYDSTALATVIDMALYDHFEIIRGAAGAFTGYGDPSGVVSLSRKKPLDHNQVLVQAEVGSWDHYRVVSDVTGPVGLDGALRARAVLAYQKQNHFYELANDSRFVGYGIVEYDVTPTTTISAGINYSKQNALPFAGGLMRYDTGKEIGWSRSTCFCFNWNRSNSESTELFGTIEKRFWDKWNLKISYNRTKQLQDSKFASVTRAVNEFTNLGTKIGDGNYVNIKRPQTGVEATLNGEFILFGNTQSVSIGINRQKIDRNNTIRFDDLYEYPGPNISVFPFNRNAVLEPMGTDIGVRQPYGVNKFLTSYLSFDFQPINNVHIQSSVRYNNYYFRELYEYLCTARKVSAGDCSPAGSIDFSGGVGGKGGEVKGSYFSWPPSVSLAYDWTKELRTYVAYADVYQDQSSSLDENSNPLPPIKGENLEVGIKWAPHDGRLNLSLSAYRILKRGFSQPIGDTYAVDPGAAPNVVYCCFVADDQNRYESKGVDFEIAGQVFENFQLTASYTYNKVQQVYGGALKQRLESLGRPTVREALSVAPRNIYRLWATYSFPKNRMFSRVTLGLGVNGQSGTFKSGTYCRTFGPIDSTTGLAPCTSSVDYDFTAPGYAVFAGYIGYQLTDKYHIALNLENLTDKTYYQSVGTVTGNWYGNPRSFNLTLTGKW
jgi:outer-membrane receptor for ferric coprogen and ferric-rhodotorulic acid